MYLATFVLLVHRWFYHAVWAPHAEGSSDFVGSNTKAKEFPDESVGAHHIGLKVFRLTTAALETYDSNTNGGEHNGGEHNGLA